MSHQIRKGSVERKRRLYEQEKTARSKGNTPFSFRFVFRFFLFRFHEPFSVPHLHRQLVEKWKLNGTAESKPTMMDLERSDPDWNFPKRKRNELLSAGRGSIFIGVSYFLLIFLVETARQRLDGSKWKRRLRAGRRHVMSVCMCVWVCVCVCASVKFSFINNHTDYLSNYPSSSFADMPSRRHPLKEREREK